MVRRRRKNGVRRGTRLSVQKSTVIVELMKRYGWFAAAGTVQNGGNISTAMDQVGIPGGLPGAIRDGVQVGLFGLVYKSLPKITQRIGRFGIGN